MSKKIIIKDQDIGIIKECAQIAFNRRPSFGTLDGKEIQLYCILSGLEMFLTSKGIEVPFSFQGFKQEDSDPVDDSPLG